MDSSTRYVPVLKGRDGEYGALQTLSESVWHVLTPVLELPPIPWDFEADRPARSIDAHLKKVGQKIERAWGTDRDIFVDLIWISETERMANSQHPLDFVFSALRARSVKAVPVIGLVRGDEYLRACRRPKVGLFILHAERKAPVTNEHNPSPSAHGPEATELREPVHRDA